MARRQGLIRCADYRRQSSIAGHTAFFFRPRRTACGWRDLEGLVATALQLTSTMAANPLSHVAQGYHRFRCYAPRMLRALDIQAAPVAEPLVEAARLVAEGREVTVRPTTFLRRSSKWHQYLQAQAPDDHRLWEVVVLFHLRDAFRSGDVWLAHSRRYADLKQALVPIAEARATPRLTCALRSGGLAGRSKSPHGGRFEAPRRCGKSRRHSRRLYRGRHAEDRPDRRRSARRSR